MSAAMLLAGCAETQPDQSDTATTSTAAQSQPTTTSAITTETTTATTAETAVTAATTGTVTDLAESTPAATTDVVETNESVNAMAPATEAAATQTDPVQIPYPAETTTAAIATTAAAPANNPIDTGITEAQAKQIALDHAGLTEADTTWLRVHLDRDDGRYVYDVDFYAGGYEYSYDINPQTGEIVAHDKEYERVPNSTTAAATTAIDGIITEAQAKQIALDHAGLTEAEVQGLYAVLDRDDGRYVYDVDFYAGGYEYSYEINPQTGEIVAHDKEYERVPGSTTAAATTAADGIITEAQAKQIALDHAGLTEAEVQGLYAVLDRDDGRRVYEVNFRVGRREYDYDIDAATGTILSSDQEYDD
jgi:uncharacterized membrane protein YkoI